ncbi:class I SAM-dependent methyltransferase [Ramlibacter sp.]|uniref:class I SAM-dependent methyltransferase n=1 Tax=Ramlibacter sp. TaxID=1917967 RepID=UPI0018232D0A|nr:class I SAM-dependent methyltransferase [Ramlibacter sp.]MBA2672841.1 methyltransferase domain-containing protein [Ramlibacter sp.]
MSKYENYDRVSANYDKTRTAVGVEIVLGFLATLPQPAGKVRILDAGCGTGNYAVPMQRWFPNLVCMDFSMGMLKKAQEKFVKLGRERGAYVQGDMGALPFRAGVFDAVVCNQSLHHIDEPGTGFRNHRSFFRHANRSLKDGGMVIINTITHEQLHDGVWWGKLIAPAVERMTQRFTSDAQLHEMLSEAGFAITDRVVPLSTIIQDPLAYYDEGALHRREFRDGDSHFSLLSESELAAVLAEVDRMRGAGEFKAYIAERDKLRQRIGQFTYFVARKVKDAS